MKEYPADWLLALRSGKYKQTKSKLRYHDGFCCLGVRCDLEDPAAWIGDRWNNESEFLPWSLLQKLEMKSSAGRLPFEDREGTQMGLSRLNDYGFTFDQIADIIECFWEVL